MDIVAFSRVYDAELGEIVAVEVNGRDLAEHAADVERPWAEAEGHPDRAGGYVGLQPSWLHGSERQHFTGGPGSDMACGPADKTVLLGCGCGEPGCWPLMARVTEGPEAIVWSDFEQPHRTWSHEGLGPFRFARARYLGALAAVETG